ncbi:MAG TPA: DUF58 domain-containing protein [Nitriliruptorales bacterium]
MPTRRGWGLVGAVLGTSLGARLVGSSELALAAQAGLVLLLFAVGFVWLLSADLDIRRQVRPRRLFFDAEGEVDVLLRNAGRRPTPTIQVIDPAPAALATANRFVISPLRRGRTATLRYRLHGRQRGVFRLGPTQVLLRDPFGFAARRMVIDNVEEVVVYPPVWRLSGTLPVGVALSGSTAQTRPAPRGTELAGVRKYVRGDDLRQVHWRTTARRGELYVRQNEAPWAPQGTVLLDARARAHAGRGPGSSLESAVASAASVVHHLSGRGLAVRLVMDSEDILRPERPWELTLERLAEIGVRSDVDLAALLRQLSTGHGLGTLVAVLGVPSSMEMRALVRAGRSYGTRAAIIVDAAAHAGIPGADITPVRTALARAGWRIGVVRPGDRLDHVWEAMTAQRPGSRAVAG